MNDKYKVLHLEDVLTDAELAARELKKGNINFEQYVIDNEKDYIHALECFAPDIILCDHSLPSFNSLDALKILKAKKLSIPFILITATMTDDVAMNIISEGADDYILKDRLQRLPHAVINAIEKFRLKKEQQNFVAELVQNEKRYRALVENGADAVVILDAEGKATYASHTVTKVLGYTEEEIMQMDLFTLAHPDDFLQLVKIFERVMANPGVPIKGHTGRMLHKNGSWRWVEATVTNLLHDQAINGIVDNFRDVTESKIAEEEIVIKEHTFRTLIENSVEGMAILSVDGKPMYVSPSIENVLGYTEEEGMDLDLIKLSHPDDVPLLMALIGQAMANPGVPVKGDATRMLNKSGDWLWIEGTITNMLHDPSINGIVDNFRDVTEKKHAEEKIIQLSRLYAFISQINQTIVHSGDKKTVFKEACRIATETGKLKAAWIGIIANEKMDFVEGSGIHPEALSKFTSVSYSDNGPLSFVLRTGTYYVCNNIQNDVTLNHWKSLAAEWGYGSFIVLPLKMSGSIIGTFNLYASELNFFTTEEIFLLEEATGDISFALDMFEKQRQKLLADELVKHKELHLNQAQAIAHVGSWELDFSTGIAVWSDEQLRIFGLQPEECEQTYQSWTSFIHPDDLDYVLLKTNETKITFNNTAFFHRIIRRDGTVRYLYCQTRFEFNNEGKPTGLYGAAVDVTEMKEAEEALRKSESNLKAIFENTSDGFILTDLNGIIKSFNNKSKDTIRLNTGAQINIGDSIFDFVHPSRKDKYKDTIAKVLSGESLQYDYAYERKNGETRWFNFSINPVWAENEVTGISITSADITERKLTANLLLRSEANLKAIIENTDAFIYSLDKDLRYVTFNSGLQNSMKDLYGIDIKPGYNAFDFINEFEPAAAEEWNNIYSKALNGEIVKFEKEYRQNNFYSCTSFSIHPIWEHTNVIGLSCFVHDITKEKKAELQVLKAYEEKNTILESIGDAFFAVDKNWVVTYWNNQAEKILFGPKDKILGKKLWDVFSDSLDSVSYKNYQQAINTNAVVHFEDYYGTLSKWFEISAYPSSDGLTVYFKDITEQKQAETALKKSEFQYRQIVETTQEGIWVIDENNKTTFVNKRMCAMMGYAEDELIGKTIQTFMDDEERKNSHEQIKRRKKGISENHDLRFIMKSGKELWTNLSTNPILDNEGNYKGALAMITDITNRKEHEIQISQNAEERELLIRELTTSLKDLKQFSYITSHNFRAPLSNLLGLLSLLDYTTLDKANMEVVEMFKTSTNQLNKTINDLVRILIIRNNVNVDVTNINIRASLKEVCNLLAHEIKENDCTINVNLSVENLLFNQSYMDSILLNLLSNAIKYRSPKRSLQIDVSTNLNSDGKLVLTMQDNGMGIDLARHHNNMFGLYQRFHSNTDSAGLGLFMVKSQITALGGSIEVNSEVDKGTTFFVTFRQNVLQ